MPWISRAHFEQLEQVEKMNADYALMAAWLHGYACGGGSVLQGVQALMLDMSVSAARAVN